MLGKKCLNLYNIRLGQIVSCAKVSFILMMYEEIKIVVDILPELALITL
jgi:hypothetical protein